MTISTPSWGDILHLGQVVSLPLRKPFRGLRQRDVMVFEGPFGPGEWAAFGEYDDEEASWWLATALEQAFAPPAIDWDDATTVPVNAIVPALPASEVEGWLGRFEGCLSIKVKVAEAGQDLTQDVERVAEVRRVAGPQVAIRLDANGSWDVTQATRALMELAPSGIDYIEQPVGTVQDMEALKGQLAVPIRLAADELVRKTHRIDHLDPEVVEVVIVKPSPLGGYRYSRELALEALKRGFDVVISSGLESSVGLSHAALLASELNQLTSRANAHGLATGVLVDGDITEKPLLPESGSVAPRRPTLDKELVARHLASTEQQEWWQRRLERCLPRALELLNHSPE